MKYLIVGLYTALILKVLKSLSGLLDVTVFIIFHGSLWHKFLMFIVIALNLIVLAFLFSGVFKNIKDIIRE